MDKLKEIWNKLPFKISPLAIIIVLLVVVIILSLTGRRSQDDTFEAFIEAYTDFDAESIVELMPKEYISALRNAGKIESKADLIAKIQNVLDYMKENVLCYDEDVWEYNYEISHTEEGKKGDDSLTIKNIQKEFGDYGNKVKQVIIINFDPIITYRDYNDKIVDEYETRNWVKLVKIGQSWYVAEFHDISLYGFTT